MKVTLWHRFSFDKTEETGLTYCFKIMHYLKLKMNKIYHYVQIQEKLTKLCNLLYWMEDHLLVFMVLTWFKPYAQYVHIFSVLYTHCWSEDFRGCHWDFQIAYLIQCCTEVKLAWNFSSKKCAGLARTEFPSAFYGGYHGTVSVLL